LFANIAIGIVVDKWGWDGAFEMIIGACILSIFFTALSWNREKQNLADLNNDQHV
jgi:OPA family glycerol-3-phosphate transporter-like MFS transporter